MIPLKAARKSIRGRPPCSLGGGGASSSEDRLDPLPEAVGDLPDGLQRLDLTLRPGQGCVS